jgi:hypothetical protein
LCSPLQNKRFCTKWQQIFHNFNSNFSLNTLLIR